ncbi:dihydrofolate reductase family protein [Saccharibacillus brassicae]|uniref:Riboflavin biosynthesis protein RibD n=1 Tax=Saccharibacillus brassicae TaxID=2583377 RepID=A0A4Y6URQ6_SACBS|nr:dihydrofolate reductase family protein [Saccharibacillus brassicae]QDH20352.1 riboflavin biosynthesis protein RibD [Saccharibacillus brassicae]
MTRVIFGMTMSLDGFINDAEGRIARLYPDFDELQASELMREAIRDTGAVIMGRRTFGMVDDPDTYADRYEFQVPIFVVTRQAPARAPKENGAIRFTFVDSPEEAVRQAIGAANGRDVTVVGGPDVGMQLLGAGLVDELQIGITPIVLGKGTRLFDRLSGLPITLRKTRVVETGQRTDLFFDVGTG